MPILRSIGLSTIGLLTLASCGDDSRSTAHDSTHPSLVNVASVCGGAFRDQPDLLEELFSTSKVIVAPRNYQSAIEQAATSLQADVPGSGPTFTHILCALRPTQSSALFSITFAWGLYHDAPLPSTSTDESSEYSGIGYEASSRDNDVLIDFSCVMQNAPTTADGRGMYIKATAETEGLDALPRAEKREAQLRVLHAAAVKVAAAMKCVTNLPTTLRTLTPLPPAR